MLDVGALGRSSAVPLVGRDEEVSAVRAFLDPALRDGGAMVLSGAAGVGKTALLDLAAAEAVGAGARVVAAAGAEFEVDVPFAGLSQVVVPLTPGIGRLAEPAAAALTVALGLGDGPPVELGAVAAATVALLRAAADDGPSLLVVDDLQWLDRASAVVLGSTARAGAPVAFLGAFRSPSAGFVDVRDLPELEVPPLDDPAAHRLVGARSPDLSPTARYELVRLAEGNPLALLELPTGPPGAPLGGPLPGAPPRGGADPVGRRLRAAFTARLEALPAAVRAVVLLAALEGTGDLRVVRAALGGAVDDLAAAQRAQLLAVDAAAERVAFRHPLVRAAVVELSTAAERRRAHRALAAVPGRGDRRVWHLAAAAPGPDEEVAALLEDASRTLLRRGDPTAAVAALVRAAELTPAAPDRSRRLAGAAHVGAVVGGDLAAVPDLLDEVRSGDPGPESALTAAAAAAHVLVHTDGDPGTARRLLVSVIEGRPHGDDGRDEALLNALWALSNACFFLGRGPEEWAPLHRALARLHPPAPLPLQLYVACLGDPVRTAGAVRGRLVDALGALDEETDDWTVVVVTASAMFLDELGAPRAAVDRVLREGRNPTATLHASGLALFRDLAAGRWDDAARHGERALELAHRLGFADSAARHGLGVLAALRGEPERAREHAGALSRWWRPRGGRMAVSVADRVLAVLALGEGDPDTAYRYAAAVSPPGVLASHVPHALWVALDLVEAAVRSGRQVEAAAHAAVLRRERVAELSSRLALHVAAAEGLVAADADAEDLFERGLAHPEADRWPFERARLQLLCGERLRRLRATSRAQEHLTAALAGFERLGARPWVERAGAELRATGAVRTGTGAGANAALTPQEREIAGLAAAGLTNKQIGTRLHLSPRTVGSHLYRVFPKLGVTSRAGLRDALDAG